MKESANISWQAAIGSGKSEHCPTQWPFAEGGFCMIQIWGYLLYTCRSRFSNPLATKKNDSNSSR